MLCFGLHCCLCLFVCVYDNCKSYEVGLERALVKGRSDYIRERSCVMFWTQNKILRPQNTQWWISALYEYFPVVDTINIMQAITIFCRCGPRLQCKFSTALVLGLEYTWLMLAITYSATTAICKLLYFYLRHPWFFFIILKSVPIV